MAEMQAVELNPFLLGSYFQVKSLVRSLHSQLERLEGNFVKCDLAPRFSHIQHHFCINHGPKGHP